MSKKYPIGVIPLAPEDGGGYLGVAADLPGCMSHADTPEKALEGAQKAILEWIDEAKEQGIAIPAPGSAAQRMRQDRESLLAQLTSQKQAIDNLDSEVKILRVSLEALLKEANDPDDRQPTWISAATIYAVGKKREQNLQ